MAGGTALLGLYAVVRAKTQISVVETVAQPGDAVLRSTALLRGLSRSLKVHPRAQYFTLRWKGTNFHDMEYHRAMQVLGYIEGDPEGRSRRYTYHDVTEGLVHRLATSEGDVKTLKTWGCAETSALMGGESEVGERL